MICLGNGDDHCCWFNGQVCEFLVVQEPDENGRKFVCSLRAELGSWDAVHADPRYAPVKARVLSLSTAPALCGDWPPPGKNCTTCGGVG